MNIKLIAVGKTDNPALQQLISTYEKRLSYYINFELQLLPDIKNSKSLSEEQQKIKEGELILSYVEPSHHFILLEMSGGFCCPIIPCKVTHSLYMSNL